MSHRTLKNLAIIVTLSAVAGCTSKPHNELGSGRYLVVAEEGIAYVQIATSSAETCAQFKSSLRGSIQGGVSKKIDCLADDQSKSLPYSLLVRDKSREYRVATFNQSQCRGWASYIGGTPGAVIAEGSCVETPLRTGGRRYFQVSVEDGTVFVQTDFGIEENCLKGAQASKAPANAKVGCSSETKAGEMHYSAILVAEGRPPLLGIDVRDKNTCEMLLKGMSRENPNYRPACRHKW